MSTAEGWYDDPSSAGRLRYWDGGDWTDWINENGETRSEPLPPPPGAGEGVSRETAAPTGRPTETGAPVPTDAGFTPSVQPAPAWDDAPGAAPAASAGAGTQELNQLQRIGFALLALGGLVSLAAIGQEATRSVGQPIVSGYDVGNGPFIIAPLLIVAGALGLFVKNPIARGIGLLAGTAGVFVVFAMLLGVRGSDQFVAKSDIAIKPGWWILFAAGAIALLGLAAAMWGGIARARKNKVLLIVVFAIVMAILLLLVIMGLITDPSSSWVQPD